MLRTICLKQAPVWIHLHKIPVNYFTLNTIGVIADAIGQVKEIAYDSEKLLLQEFVRVLVILDLAQPVRDTKSFNLPNGSVAIVEVEYERAQKKCFHCMRLSHEKQRCPLLQGQHNRGNNMANMHQEVMGNMAQPRQHHSNLSEILMSLLTPTVPPGFEPLPNMVSPEVF